MNTTNKIERLKKIIIENSFKYATCPSFKLSSGIKSHFYFDCKKTTLDPEGSNLIGELLFERLKDRSIKAVGGLTLGADPLAAAVMHVAYSHGVKIKQFIVRKELKQHGAIKWIEGNLQQGERVLIVDDVVTTGGSVIKAIKRTMEDGFIVEGVIVLIDREEFDGMEEVRKVIPGKPVETLITRTEIMQLYENKSSAISSGSPTAMVNKKQNYTTGCQRYV